MSFGRAKQSDARRCARISRYVGDRDFHRNDGLCSFGKTAEAILLLSNVLADGKDVRQFIRDWLSHYRGLLISKFVKDAADILNISSENAERLKEQSDKIDIGEINYAIVEISKTMADAKWSTQPRVLLELCIVKLSESSMRKEISVHTPRRSEPIQKHSIKEEPAVRRRSSKYRS